MNTTLLMIFIVLNIVNVIIQTVKSICTIHCGKVVASLVNAVAYGLYTIVLIYMTCDLNTYLKALIVALCNLVGVYVVKLIEEKTKKDKLWKIELAVHEEDIDYIESVFEKFDIPYNVIETSGSRVIINAYANTQSESADIKKLTSKLDVKYFVTESKAL